jgi:membrane-associated phospholipid phosphatase
MGRDQFWHWPGVTRLRYAALLGLAVAAWFELVYAGANFVTAQHHYRVRVHFPAELRIRFMPATVLAYVSIYPLFWSAPFILRSRRELRSLAVALAVVIGVAGLFFLALPARSVFPPLPDMGAWTGLVRGTKWVALENNLMPSLHVALTVVCVAVYARQAKSVAKVLLWLWAATIAASTLFLHQHYVADVITGFALGLAGVRWVYDAGPDLLSRAATRASHSSSSD